ncbi:MAG: hypothetical protein LUF28_07920 [Clostridiales bacterium]|nr:hypothetical protein [Clostridiales bacterium]
MKKIASDKQNLKSDSGTIILESTFCILVCMVVLLLLLSVGFYLYQVVLIQVVANETAENIATTYKYADLADSADLTADDIANIGLYRYWFSNGTNLEEASMSTGASYANGRLSKTSLAQSNGSATVTVESVTDDIGRMHYEVTVTQTYTFLLGDILNMIGLNGTQQMSATAYAQGVDVSYYINSIKTWKSVTQTVTGLSGEAGVINSVLGMLSSAIKLIKDITNFN